MSTRQRIVLLVLLLFVVPALITTAMLASNLKDETLDGMQPGGVIRGEVRDRAGKPIADLEVDAFALGVDGSRARLGAVTTNANGTFEFNVQPVRGHYEFRTGGGDWVEQRTDVTRLDRKGSPTPGKPAIFVLDAASRLVIEFVRSKGRSAGAGTWDLIGSASPGLFTSGSSAPVRRSGSFEEGRLEIAGLLPSRVRFFAHFASGERVDVVLDLTPGRNHHKVEL